jgi:CRISPR-associated protein Csb3
MQPRNQGSEFVGTRLRKLAETVAARDTETIAAGLRGDSIEDELGGNSSGSRTATGLASPGPVDNALAWCALWGISQFPLAMRVNHTPNTSGHLSQHRREWFYVPVWFRQRRPARLRSVLANRDLRTVSAARLGLPGYTDAQISAAQANLAAWGIAGVIRFDIHRFGSDNAPERRAMRGETIAVRGGI